MVIFYCEPSSCQGLIFPSFESTHFVSLTRTPKHMLNEQRPRGRSSLEMEGDSKKTEEEKAKGKQHSKSKKNTNRQEQGQREVRRNGARNKLSKELVV